MSESTQVVSYEERLKQQLQSQQMALAKVAGGSKYISCKGGLMTIDKQPVPGNQLDVIVVAFVNDRAWYAGAFDPDSIQAPDCYAIEAPHPHEKARDPQCNTCETCPKNQWGSAMRDGKPTRGKACREAVRVAVLSANNLDPEYLKVAESRIVKFPPTSIANFREFTQTCLNAGKLTFGVTARLQVKPDSKTMFKIVLTPLQEIKDRDALAVLMMRSDTAAEEIRQPYMDDEETEEAPVEETGKKKKF